MNINAMSAGAISLAVLSFSSFAQAKSMSCAAVTTKQIESLFDRWNGSLATLDPAKVTANYASDAVLLPTVSNTPRTDSASIQEYFVHFLEKHPQGKIDTRTIKIGCNMASDVGTYTFTLSGTVARRDADRQGALQLCLCLPRQTVVDRAPPLVGHA